MEVTLGDSTTTWARLESQTVHGRGVVFPRVAFLFAAWTPRERMAVQLHVMRGELVAGRELLGQGVLTGISLNQRDLQVTLEVPVSRASLECLDHQVTGSRVDVALSGWLNGRDDNTDSRAMLIGVPERGGFRVTRVARWISSVRRLGLTLAVVAATLLCGSVTAVVAAVPAVHTCGYFFKKGNDVIMFRSGPVSCAHATSIIRAFWSGVGVTMHGTSDATGYFTIHAWPGGAATRLQEPESAQSTRRSRPTRSKARPERDVAGSLVNAS